MSAEYLHCALHIKENPVLVFSVCHHHIYIQKMGLQVVWEFRLGTWESTYFQYADKYLLCLRCEFA